MPPCLTCYCPCCFLSCCKSWHDMCKCTPLRVHHFREPGAVQFCVQSHAQYEAPETVMLYWKSLVPNCTDQLSLDAWPDHETVIVTDQYSENMHTHAHTHTRTHMYAHAPRTKNEFELEFLTITSAPSVFNVCPY